jgi:hypothetical protein
MEMPMADKRDGKRWTRARGAWLFAAFLVIYVLSFGPVIWLSRQLDPHHTGWPGWIAGLVYGPLVMASNVIGTKTILLDYLRMFVDVKP